MRTRRTIQVQSHDGLTIAAVERDKDRQFRHFCSCHKVNTESRAFARITTRQGTVSRYEIVARNDKGRRRRNETHTHANTRTRNESRSEPLSSSISSSTWQWLGQGRLRKLSLSLSLGRGMKRAPSGVTSEATQHCHNIYTTMTKQNKL